MNKKEFIGEISKSTGVTRKDLGKVIDAALELIAMSLEREETVGLVGFGTFKVRDRVGRMGINPRTGERMKIEATKTPAFMPSKTLKRRLNNR